MTLSQLFAVYEESEEGCVLHDIFASPSAADEAADRLVGHGARVRVFSYRLEEELGLP